MLDTTDTLPPEAIYGRPCDACGAESGEPCRPMCIGLALHEDEATLAAALADPDSAAYEAEAEYLDEMGRQEVWAEGAWLRAAEAGTPETWAEEDRDRMIDALGYGPPPGY